MVTIPANCTFLFWHKFWGVTKTKGGVKASIYLLIRWKYTVLHFCRIHKHKTFWFWHQAQYFQFQLEIPGPRLCLTPNMEVYPTLVFTFVVVYYIGYNISYLLQTQNSILRELGKFALYVYIFLFSCEHTHRGVYFTQN